MSHEKILSPQALLKSLGMSTVISGHGEFKLLLEVKAGNRKIKKEVSFEVGTG